MIKEPPKVRSRAAGRTLIYEISGIVDNTVPSAEELAAKIQESKSRLAILDFSQASSIDPDGLRWLEQIAARLQPAGVKVRVVSPEGSKIRRMLKLLRYDRFLLVLGSIFDALTFGRRRKR